MKLPLVLRSKMEREFMTINMRVASRPLTCLDTYMRKVKPRGQFLWVYQKWKGKKVSRGLLGPPQSEALLGSIYYIEAREHHHLNFPTS